MKTIKCKFCGKITRAERVAKQYCDDNCRVAYHRLDDKIKKAAAEALAALATLGQYSENYPEKNTLILGLLNEHATELKQLYNDIKSRPHNKRLEGF